jgi:hypothetical protein
MLKTILVLSLKNNIMSNTNKGNAAQGKATQNENTKGAKPELSTLTIGPKVEEKTEAAPEPKPQHQEAPILKKGLTVDERKQKALLFETLLTKHEQITEAKNKLEKFVIAGNNADVGQGIRLTDNKNNVFSTSNSIVLSECIKLIQKHTQEQFEAIEKEVLNFQI